MDQPKKLSTKRLIKQTTLKITKFALLANISYPHMIAVLNGENISETYAQRIVNKLNELLKPEKPYTIEMLDLNVSDLDE